MAYRAKMYIVLVANDYQPLCRTVPSSSQAKIY